MSEEEIEDVHEESSLDQLSQAFAEAMGRSNLASPQQAGDASDGPSSDVDVESGNAADDADDVAVALVDPDESCPISPKSIFEAILFVGHPGNQPISGKSIANLIRGVDENELPALMKELNDGYIEYEMPYEVVRELLFRVDPDSAESGPNSETAVSAADTASEAEAGLELDTELKSEDRVSAGESESVKQEKTAKSKKKRHKTKQGVAGYRLRIREEFEYLRENFYGRVREAQLSQLAVDVLAVVAYNQPITREDINRMLDSGLDTGRVINQLVRRDLLARHSNQDASKSRRREYVTTPRFLQFFNLESVNDLPKTDAPDSLR